MKAREQERREIEALHRFFFASYVKKRPQLNSWAEAVQEEHLIFNQFHILLQSSLSMLSCKHFFMLLQYENARKKLPLQKVRTAGC